MLSRPADALGAPVPPAPREFSDVTLYRPYTGGAWNASIVAEYSTFGGRTVQTRGLGALISHATAEGAYPLLLAATLTMILIVTLFNRFVWRRLYRLAEERYRME